MALHPYLSRRVLTGVSAVLLTGFAISAASLLAARDSDARASLAGMQRRADLTSAAVRGEILRYQEILTMLASAMSAQSDLRSGNFATITQPLLHTRLRGASGVLLLVEADTGDTASVQTYWRQQGAEGLVLQPMGTASRHVYPVLSRSLDGRSSVLGRDLSSTPQLMEMIDLARTSGRMTVSEPYVLSKDLALSPQRRQVALVLTVEVTDPGGRPRGWLVMALRGADLLAETLTETGQGAINATLVAAQPDRRVGTLVSHVSGRATETRLTRRASIDVAQRHWTLVMQGTDAAARRDSAGGVLTRSVLVGGPCITLLMAGLTLSLMTSRQRALLAVDRAAGEVREADERFRLAFDQAHTGMAIIDMRPGLIGTFIRVNTALCTMLGYRAEELVGRNFVEITHPDEIDQSSRRVGDLVDGDVVALEKRYLHADGHPVWTSVSSTLVRSADGRPAYAVSQIENITERRAETQRLSAMALQDPLTGLGNRLLFDERMAEAVVRAIRSQRLIGVVFCDLNRFKEINDTYGHAAGDAVLEAVAARIRSNVRPADTVARLGGDEFIILCEDLVTPAGCERVGERILRALEPPIDLPNGITVRIGCSLGTATAGPVDGEIDPAALLHEADLAMYRSKPVVDQPGALNSR